LLNACVQDESVCRMRVCGCVRLVPHCLDQEQEGLLNARVQDELMCGCVRVARNRLHQEVTVGHLQRAYVCALNFSKKDTAATAWI
jgi:hypothetical protein